ncbi:MAG: IS21-like element helper ATPase IstB [Planctomycetota bacterium]|jgi:DNA replication protein DnaC
MTNHPPSLELLADRARRLGLYGLLAHWQELGDQPWVQTLITHEEAERRRRSLERRIRTSKVGRFRPIADFNWSWLSSIDRQLIEELLQLGFIEEAANVILIGPNGVGKSTIAQNIAHQALLRGHTLLCTTASAMLNDLAAQDTSTALARRLRRYTAPAVLLVDEVGYLSYDSRAADLLFEVVSRRHEQRPIILTTNKPFAEWNEVFPNSSSVTALVDRLLHRAEIVKIEGQSYRAKEAKERAAHKARQRAARSKRTKNTRKNTSAA